MKNTLLLLSLCCGVLLFAQAPSGYYNHANGLSGAALKTALSTIITNGHSDQGYNALFGLYDTSDNDTYYDNGTQSNTILDMYSENPNGPEAYNYATFTGNRCGNYNSEGDCFNREHVFPQGFFNQGAPMRSDAHHVIPTDGYVNGGRSNLPFGEVSNSAGNVTTYTNGSKRGPSVTPGYSGVVFEPIDEFKGDLARILFYFATRYESNYNDSSWDSHTTANDTRNGTPFRFYEDWYVDLLLSWHAADPVSQKEIDRNNAIYTYQGNRNPYVDNPAYVGMIWIGANPSGEITITMNDSYTDTNTNGTVDAGDVITYSYQLNNTGGTPLYNLVATATNGSFSGSNTLSTMSPGQSLNDPFGSLTVTLTTSDISSAVNCQYLNQVSVSADFTSAGGNGGGVFLSDDPNNTTNADTDNDGLPDDANTTDVCNTGGGALTFTRLFISEYIEGSGNNKALELCNWTGAPVNLNGYTIARDSNGNGVWQNTYTLSGAVADREVYVLARGAADPAITNQADVLIGNGGVMDYNGNDPIGLFYNGNLIDIVGSFGSGSADFAKDETLTRKVNVQAPVIPFDKARDWIVQARDDSSDLGMHTASTLATGNINDNHLAIYPNPSAGRSTIMGLQGGEKITLFDTLGRQVSSSQSSTVIAPAAGLYLVRIASEEGTQTLKWIVK